tara:strand:+ start:3828 stop:4877 length:1050 start_codon:yes stop_codon:yes gene_type:complete
MMKKKITYKDAGVDIEKADDVIALSKKSIQETFSSNVLSSIGGFGSMYSLKDFFVGFKDPVLVQSIDGVGTKMSVARAANNFQHIGQDLVNACCNDVAATGAQPLTFLDYVAGSNLEKGVVAEIIKSVASECKKHGVSLVGGETAEMPGTYHKNEYDLVGVAAGVIEKDKIIDGSSVQSGDIAVGVRSSGLHTNGYSLARKLIFDSLGLSTSDLLPGYDISVADCLLAPHTNYSTLIQALNKKNVNIKSIAHITGGGLIDNVPRVLPGSLSLDININSWPKMPIFEFFINSLDIKKRDLYQTFNMGVGLVLIIDAVEKEKLQAVVGAKNCSEIGVVIKDDSNMVYLNEK